MKRTLLDMTQQILSDMNSDQVNGVADTEESLKVANTIKTVYYEILGQRDWPWLFEITALEGVGDVNNPTKLRIPEEIVWIDFIKYNKQNPDGTGPLPPNGKELNFQHVHWLEPYDFCNLTYRLNSDIPEVTTVTENGVRLLIENDKHPTYWTTFDDEFVIMNAFNKDFETTLEQFNNVIRGERLPLWQMEDTFIPDLPTHMFPLLLAEATSTAFMNIKQVANQKSEQQSRRQLLTQQKRSWKTRGQANNTPNYGRNRGPGHSGRVFWRGRGQRQDSLTS